MTLDKKAEELAERIRQDQIELKSILKGEEVDSYYLKIGCDTMKKVEYALIRFSEEYQEKEREARRKGRLKH